MKVTISIELDIPGAEDFSDDELRQIVFDEYVNYTTTRHMEDALAWTSRKPMLLARAAAGDEDVANIQERSARLVHHHQTWAEICENATFEMKRG